MVNNFFKALFQKAKKKITEKNHCEYFMINRMIENRLQPTIVTDCGHGIVGFGHLSDLEVYGFVICPFCGKKIYYNYWNEKK